MTDAPQSPSLFAKPDAVRVLLESILSSVPDAMIVINRAGDILAFSRAAETLFGYQAGQVLGRNVSMLMTGADAAHHDTYVRNYLETARPQIIGVGRVVQAQNAAGEHFPVMLKIGEANIGGEPVFTGYIRDVTAEQERQHQLTHMQVELERFSRLSAVGGMASAMAHELNQPLTAIANYLEAVRDMIADGDTDALAVAQEALDAAAGQSIKAGKIVRRLRDYVSRGEIDAHPTALAPVIQDALTLVKLGQTGVVPRIDTAIPDDFPHVRADRLQVRQVVLNLLRNAIEAIDGVSNPAVAISAFIDGDKAVIHVADNGPGLGLEESASPFEPFVSTKASGMGLGLSICQTIVQAHGGDIWHEPAPGGGACFCFSLDLHKATTTS